MYKNKAFTFVEIIVSITIISLISVSWVFYFNDFIWKQDMSIHINNFENTIQELNYNIKQHKIFDYKLHFKKNTSWYTISQNNIWVDYYQEFSFDTINNNWTINIIPSTADIWEIKIYKWKKKTDEITKNWSELVNFNIDDNITIVWTLSWSTLNTLNFIYFDNMNWKIDKNLLILDILDNISISQNSLTIQNINWNKQYYNNWLLLNKPITIIFEKNWIEDKLVLN